jgi:hypothetical protein
VTEIQSCHLIALDSVTSTILDAYRQERRTCAAAVGVTFFDYGLLRFPWWVMSSSVGVGWR